MGFSFGSITAPFNPSQWGSSDDPLLGGSLGDFIPGIGDARAAAEQNAQNARYANNQMNFQERMSNTAYQRAMRDMKNAGLNPMLAFSQGGASTPTGAMPTTNSTTKSKLGEFAASTGMGIKDLQMKQQTADQQGAEVESKIAVNKAVTAQTVAETANTQADTRLKDQQAKRQSKYEPLDDFAARASKKASTIADQIIEGLSNTASELGRSKMSPETHEWDFKHNKVKLLQPVLPLKKDFKK